MSREARGRTGFTHRLVWARLTQKGIVAEREGFEPSVRLPAQRFSRPPHSTTLPPLREVGLPLVLQGPVDEARPLAQG